MASLSGKSRSGGTTNWQHYVVSNFDKETTLSIEKDTTLFDIDWNELVKLKKNDVVKVLDINLTKKGVSSYASVQYKRYNGLVSISSLRKPTIQSTGSIIGGGRNSKEFTPDKLGLDGTEYTNIGQFTTTVSNALVNFYGDAKYKEIRKYLSDITKSITGYHLTEKINRFSINYKPRGSYNIAQSDMKIISKNFGEVVGAMYLLKHNKKMTIVGFPGSVNEGLYDIYGKDKKGRVYYYSAKSAGGSSTSLANLNFIKRNFSSDNAFLMSHVKEMEIIDSLINTKEHNTIYNITAFFNKNLPNKTKEIIGYLNELGNEKIGGVEQGTLSRWFESVKVTNTEQEFVDVMNKIYDTVFSGGGRTTDGVLRKMFNAKDNPHKNGYLLYPMGSYIVTFLNSKDKYIEALNILAGFASYISQITVNMSKIHTEIQIIKFSKNKFKFTYNGMSNAPGNRPIGFKEQ